MESQPAAPLPSKSRAIWNLLTAPKGREADVFEAVPELQPIEVKRRPFTHFVDSDKLLVTDDAFLCASLSWATELVRRQMQAPFALLSVLTPSGLLYLDLAGFEFDESDGTALARSERTLCEDIARGQRPYLTSDGGSELDAGQQELLRLVGCISYAGLSFEAGGGLIKGALCAADSTSREWNNNDFAVVERLAEAVGTQLEMSLARDVQHHTDRTLASALAMQLRTPLRRIQEAVSSSATDERSLEAVRDCQEALKSVDLLARLGRS